MQTTWTKCAQSEIQNETKKHEFNAKHCKNKLIERTIHELCTKANMRKQNTDQHAKTITATNKSKKLHPSTQHASKIKDIHAPN